MLVHDEFLDCDREYLYILQLVQVTVSLEMEDNDSSKECLYAKGLSEFVTWLNADKVRIFVVGSLSIFCTLQDFICWTMPTFIDRYLLF